MIFLQNELLKISVLDPLTDQKRFGSRYCTGGYIWQVYDKIAEENLLSGPAYPSPDPPVFDGQGLPEVFETAICSNTASVGDEVLVIGVGTVLRRSPVSPFHVRDNPDVVSFCKWDTDVQVNKVTMKTSQDFKGHSLDLIREIYLDKRTLTSQTTIHNKGELPFQLRWFAHPFFPHPEDGVCCNFSLPVNVPENPGFFLNVNGYLEMKREHQWEKGCYRPLELPWGERMIIRQRHKTVSEIQIKLGFPLAWMPVWGNRVTFSFEPYYETELKPLSSDNSANWHITYVF